MENITDLYTDYLLSSFGQTTATGLSSVLEEKLSHDKITRHLVNGKFGGKALWLTVKPFVKQYRSTDACLVFDDTIIEKPRSKEDSLNTWHYDHSKGTSVKGINVLNCLYHSTTEKAEVHCPVNYHLVTKPIVYSEIATKKQKRKAEVTKNDAMRGMIAQAIHNQLPFRYVLADSWFCSNENMRYIDRKNKCFVLEIKTNRLACRDGTQRDKSQWAGIKEVAIGDAPVEAYLKGLDIKVLLVRQVFNNKDGSTGERYLVSNDLDLDKDGFMTVYKKRWSVEEYHKGIKQNASVGKSPANSIRARIGHIYHAVLAYVKLEKLRMAHKTNHFAMKAKIYMAAVRAAFKELKQLRRLTPELHACVT